MKKGLLFFLFIISFNQIKSIERAIENAIETSDTTQLLRLVSGNFTVSQEEKAYYLKLAKAKSERAMARVYNSLPKFSRTLMNLVPTLLGIGIFSLAAIRLYPHYAGMIKEDNEGNNFEKNFGKVCLIASALLMSLGGHGIYSGILENNETIERDNALANETIIARLRIS